MLRFVSILFGRDGLGEVPQFERVVLRHCDQTRLDRMEGQRSDAVKMAPQCVLGVPRLPERGLLIGRQLRLTENRERGYSLSVNAAEECVFVSYIVAVVCFVVGDGEVSKITQTQHALQHII